MVKEDYYGEVVIMVNRLSMCTDCGASVLNVLPKCAEVLEKLINNTYIVVEGCDDWLWGKDDREKIDFIKSYFNIPKDDKKELMCSFEMDELVNNKNDFQHFLKTTIGYNQYQLYASRDVWFVLYATYCSGLEYVDCKIEKDYQGSSIHKIEAITVKKGKCFYEWYDKFSNVDVVVDNMDETCPICGGEIRVPNRDLKKVRVRGRLVINSFLNRKLDPFLKECENVEVEFNNKPNIESKEEIITYLKHLVAVENGIRFYSECFRNIYFEQWMCKWNVNNDKIDIKMELAKKKREVEKQLEGIDTNLNAENKILNDKDALARKFGMKYPRGMICPQEPQIQKPLKPTLLKANLFNKSKIEKENNMLMEKYNHELSCYNEKWEKYNEELEIYNKNEKYKMEFDEQYPILLSKQEEEVQKWNTKRQEIIVCMSNIEQDNENETSALLEQRKSTQLLNIYLEEMEEIKTTLSHLVNCRTQLHSMDVIFPKYLEYVSVVTILEYFQSGRCTELTGADGAYNLYESELRQNIIIGKLDDIADKLDDIKQSQYLLYTSLENINNSISVLNDTFEKAVTSLSNIEESLETIKENTALTAYYSAKTAEYTKRNAELTNALGYLVAFK